ncbi:MAG TPA: zinc-binding dehydrogenase [Steroidobacteraceae bacterium]
MNKNRESLQIRSLVKADGDIELSLAVDHVPMPGPEEVVVRLEAAPLNPSDLILLLGIADWANPKVAKNAHGPVVSSPLAPAARRALAARVGESMPVGNEGAGIVVEAGSSPGAQALLGKKVGVLGGAMYSQFRCLPITQCLLLPEDATAAEGASSFVNPLTALGMIGTLQREGHKALIHTAAASNLGQMLNRLCQKDGIPLINIVRSDEQAQILKKDGARLVCNSGSESFMQELTEAMVSTGATLAFDAIGGGNLVSQILTCMEIALNRGGGSYNRYGSSTHKQVYIYGSLDMNPTVLNRSYGLAWSVSGWLLTPYIQKIGPEAFQAMKSRVARELKTTFRSHYTAEISLAEALDPKIIASYNRRATGQKFLIVPQKGL